VIPDDVRKLLGGYATGTLTDEERNLLFSAALEHQELFDALADEEALRELLAEPATRQTLLEQLQRQSHAVHPPPRSARSAMPRMCDRFTPRRLAVAGGLAMLLLIAGGLQYRRLHAPEPATVASVDLSMSRPPASSVRESETAPRPIPRSATPAKVAAPKEAAPQVADARVQNAGELDRAIQRNDENRAVVPPAAATGTVDSEKKPEKDTAEVSLARQQLNQAVRDQVARQPVPQEASKETESAGNATPRSPSGKISERRTGPISPSQIVTGGLSRALAPLPPPAPGAVPFSGQIREIDAKVTDINGTIVSVNAGSNAGLRTGDVVEIVRENRVIATSKLSQVGAAFAVGPFQRTPGSADAPQAGDTVRRAAATQPQR